MGAIPSKSATASRPPRIVGPQPQGQPQIQDSRRFKAAADSRQPQIHAASDFTQRRGFPIDTIAEALDSAHRAGFIHRDLKPSNVMIAAAGHVKIFDFGLASRLDAREANPDLATETSPVSDPGTMMGTPAYMAPEQVTGPAR